MRKLFGTDGIRAVAGEAPLDKRTIYAIGVALATRLALKHKPVRIVLGMDTRESGPWIAATLTAGLRAAGASVESAGILTTPAIAFLARKHGFSPRVVISASHNPWQDNGIKIFGHDGYKLPDETEIGIEAKNHKSPRHQPYHPRRPDPPRGHRVLPRRLHPFPPPGRPRHLPRQPPHRPRLRQRRRQLRSPAAIRVPHGTVDVTHASPDGRNINERCGALHPEIVAAQVKVSGASMGITFDGDADRALFSDEHGNVVNGDAVMLACAAIFNPAAS